MLLREAIYQLMSAEMLNKRVVRLGVKMQKETNPRKKIKILGDVTDAFKATIRKNRFDKAFLRKVGNELQIMLDESESKVREL